MDSLSVRSGGSLEGETRVDEHMQESSARLQSLIDRAPFGICRSSLSKDRFEAVNPALCRMLGYSEAELLAMSLSQQLYATAPNRLEMIELLKRDRKLQAQETVLQRKDGSQIRVRANAFLTPDENGDLDRVEAYIEDLTEQSALEQQVRAVQKLEAVGRLAGGVAHDFNNILVVIKLSTEMMLGQITPESPLSRPLLQVSKAADRAAALTRQMLAFSRRQMMQARVVNLNEVVSDTLHMLRRIIGEDINLVTRLADDLSNSKLDPDQLGQVVLNLAVNARDAMPRGGTLQIETANVELDDAYCTAHPPVHTGKYAMLAVTDTGTGIAKSDLPHIFRPFLYHQGSRQGHGSGLVDCVWNREAVRWLYLGVQRSRAGNDVQAVFSGNRLRSRPDRATPQGLGTRPRARPFLSSTTMTRFEPTFAIACKVSVTRSWKRRVERLALEICDENRAKIDLVMTDLIMPGMGGQELARNLANRFPTVRVLITSGYTEDCVARRDLLQAGKPFLEKPFSVAALASAVEEALFRAPQHQAPPEPDETEDIAVASPSASV